MQPGMERYARKNVVVVVGAGQIGLAIARRVGVGKHIVLADRIEANANAAADVMGNASPETILQVDLYGTAVVLEQFGNVNGPRRIRRGHLIAVWPSLARAHDRAKQGVGDDTHGRTAQVALPPAGSDKESVHAYQLSKRGNALRVMAEAVHWGKRGARINTISPGIVMTPLAKDELSGSRGPATVA